MANPQKENSFIPIATEIAEVLAKTQLNGYESRYLWVLWRKTWGWGKKEDIIANNQFVKATGVIKQHIWRTEQRLIARNIVTKIGNKLSFQKDYEKWLELPKLVTVTKSGIGVTKIGNKVTKIGGHNRYYTKDTITKDIEKPPNIEFFENPLLQEEAIKYLIDKGISAELATSEIKKFIEYWTELSKNGRQVRWQGQKFFDVRRRLGTWFKNIKQFNTIKNSKFSFN